MTGEGTKKAASREGRGRRMGREVGSVPVETTVRADAPSVNRGRGNGTYLALHNQCLIDGRLGRLERGGGDCPEIGACGAVYVNVEGLHGVGVGYMRMGIIRPNASFPFVGVAVMMLFESSRLKTRRSAEDPSASARRESSEMSNVTQNASGALGSRLAETISATRGAAGSTSGSG